jgi:rhodanese-related sulfurtransferase
MTVQQITPRQAQQLVQAGAALVDVREEHEYAMGMAQGAVGIPRAELERDPGRHFPDRSRPIVLICQAGGRSMLAAEILQRVGYLQVSSVQGGMNELVLGEVDVAPGIPLAEDGLPEELPGLDDDEESLAPLAPMKSTPMPSGGSD